MRYPGEKDPPKSIRYTYPDGKQRRGTIEDRVAERSSGKNGDYLMLIEKSVWKVNGSLR